MTNDVFVAFWCGMGGGAVIGIVIAAIMSAISNTIERKAVNNQRAIAVMSDELRHCELHIQDKGKAPEYYQEMQELIDSYNIAIEAMKELAGEA